jgi:hypothetical protein
VSSVCDGLPAGRLGREVELAGHGGETGRGQSSRARLTRPPTQLQFQSESTWFEYSSLGTVSRSSGSPGRSGVIPPSPRLGA